MPFSDPIVAGETLVRQAIQSEGFLTGSAGWRIERVGDAEFNDAIIRGFFQVLDAFGNEMTMPAFLNTASLKIMSSGGNYILFQSTASVGNADAITWHNATTGNAQSIVGQQNSANVSKMELLSRINGDGSSNYCRIHISRLSTGNEIVVSNFIKAQDPVLVGMTSETWHNFTLNAGWVVSGTLTPGYRLMPDGSVRFRGNIQNGTTVPGTVIANVPAGYRPVATADHYFTVAMPNNNTVNGTIDVLANGDVRCIASPGVATLSFDQISYMTI